LEKFKNLYWELLEQIAEIAGARKLNMNYYTLKRERALAKLHKLHLDTHKDGICTCTCSGDEGEDEID
jgi:hypothetical protein